IGGSRGSGGPSGRPRRGAPMTVAAGVAAAPRVAPVTLEGRHVRLEPLGLAHAAALVAAACGPRDTYHFTLVPPDLGAMRAYIESALADQTAGRALPFATVSRGSGQVVGCTRFGNIECWTWLAAAAQRTPLNTEAKLLMLTHAFEVWRVHAVKLNTDARNARSRAAI